MSINYRYIFVIRFKNRCRTEETEYLVRDHKISKVPVADGECCMCL